ncbi:MAG: DUF6603 domain-containing protein, partial [Bacteroidota bacterium]
ARLAVMAGSSEILGLSLKFDLEGPTPWRAKGTAKFKILFVSVKVKFDKKWGEERDTLLPEIDVMPLLLEALNQDQNWKAIESPNRGKGLVTIKRLEEEEGMIFKSEFKLEISQNVVPLNYTITKFGNKRPKGVDNFRITDVRIGTESETTDDTRAPFPPDAFKELDNAAKLAAPSFETFDNGVTVKSTSQFNAPYYLNRPVEYEVHVKDFSNPIRVLLETQKLAVLFNQFASKGDIYRSDLSNKTKRYTPDIKESVSVIQEEPYVVVNQGDLSAANVGITSTMNFSQAEQAMQVFINQNPEMESELMVVPAYMAIG